MKFFLALMLCLLICAIPAAADIGITSAIVEFNQSGPRQQDIEVVSHSQDNQYIVAEVNEVLNPGAPNETRRPVKDPAQTMLLVTPDKTILAGDSRKVLRFVLLKEPDAAEHIYRVAIKPVIRGLNNNSTVGLKILIGYEVLVIVRPAQPQPSYTAVRDGAALLVTNKGNTNILFQNGQQCLKADHCTAMPAVRIYPGGHEKINCAQMMRPSL